MTIQAEEKERAIKEMKTKFMELNK